MSLKTTIKDGKGSQNEAAVSSRGQLIVAPLDFSTAYEVTLAVTNIAHNLVAPKTGERFVITAIILSGNKNIGTDGAEVELYEATAADEILVDKLHLKAQMIKNGSLVVTPLNILMSEGRWLNAKTDDDDIFITVTGYYIKA